jgi:hypothetical protein
MPILLYIAGLAIWAGSASLWFTPFKDHEHHED